MLVIWSTWTADCTKCDSTSRLVLLVGYVGFRAFASTRQEPESACSKCLLARRINSHFPGIVSLWHCLCGRPRTAIPLPSSGCCHIWYRPMAPHHCRLAAYASNSFSFKMQILFFCLFGPRIPDLQYVECAENGATRLNARYTYSPLSCLLPLGQPDVVPQAWAGRRQVFVPGCVHQAVVFLPGIFLAFLLATPYRSHRSSWSTTVARHRGWLCRRSCVFGLPPLCHLLQSNRDHRANARFLPQLYHLGGGC